MKKWEYMIINPDTTTRTLSNITLLNELGSQGWQIVAVTNERIILKRELA